MSDLKRPKPGDVEGIMNKFVNFIGGELVTNLMAETISTLNADYYFKSQDIIAELKCFKKDLFTNEDDAGRLNQLLEIWKKKII